MYRHFVVRASPWLSHHLSGTAQELLSKGITTERSSHAEVICTLHLAYLVTFRAWLF